MNHRYFITLLVLGVFAVGNLIPAGFVFGAMYQNLNPTGDQTIAPASGNFESGEAVWVNDTFVVRTRAGGTGTLRSLQLTTGSSNPGLIINSSGNVGIGTTGPGAKLDVQNGYINSSGGLKVTGFTTPIGAGNEILYAGGSGFFQTYDRTGGVYLPTIIDGLTTTINTGGSAKLTVLNNGNVGIATTTPSYKLDVVGTSQFSQPVIVGTPTNASHAATKNYVDSIVGGGAGVGSFATLTVAGTSTLATNANDRVGIGTTSPGDKFVVAGGKLGILNDPAGNTYGWIYGSDVNHSIVFRGDRNGTAGNFTNYYQYGGTIAGGYGHKFWTGGLIASQTLKMQIADDGVYFTGNVGIGTTAPNSPLQVSFPAADLGFTSGIWLDGSANGGTVGRGVGMTVQNNDVYVGGIYGIRQANNWQGALAFYTHTSTVGNSFGTSYTEKMRIDSEGNVGIGTTGPRSKLDLNGGIDMAYAASTLANNAGGIRWENGSSITSAFGFEVQNGLWFQGSNDVGNQDFGVRGNTIDGSLGTVDFVVKGSGNVGIATTTPSYKLDVVGTSQFSQPVIVGTPTQNAHATTKSYVDSMFTGSGQWTTNGGLVYLTSTTQNVGIGTTSPGYMLDVAGNVRVQGTNKLYIGSNFLYSTAGSVLTTSGRLDIGAGGLYIWDGGVLNATGNILMLNKAGSAWMSVGTKDTSGSEAVLNLSNIGSITTNGNVGIGTASPGALLHVNSTVAAGGQASGLEMLRLSPTYSGTAGSGAFINFVNNTDNTALGQIRSITESASNVGLSFSTYNYSLSEKMRILASGNVGIGTTAPGSNLEVNAGSANLTKDILTVKGGGSSGNYGFSVQANNGGELFKVDTLSYNVTMANGGAGSVGIATTTPSYKLDVVGTSQFSQPVIVGTPTQNAHATTKSYVDSMFTGSGQWTTNGGLVYLTSTTQNVGIGTTSPLSAGNSGLHIYANGSSINAVLRIEQAYAGAAGVPALQLKKTNNAVDEKIYDFIHLTNGQFAGRALNDAENSATNWLLVDRTGTTIDSVSFPSGNVGIGTTSPAGARLVVKGLANDWGIMHTNSLGNKIGGFYEDISNNGVIYQLTNAGAWNTQISASGVTYFNGGNVGIATSTPNYSLTVNGYGWFNQPVFVGTPTNASHAATKSYVDSIIGGSTSSTSNYVLKTGDAMSGNLNMNGNNITAINKLTVTTIDPLYQIGGAKYATYASAIAGGVKEEFVGRGRLTAISNSKFQILNKSSNESNVQNSENKNSIKIQNLKLNNSDPTQYEYVIDFSKVEKGSDLWVWYKAVEFNKENVEVLATAYGVPVPISYIIEDNKIIFNSSLTPSSYTLAPSEIEFSYRFVGKRFDWREHPTYAKDQSEPAGLIVK